MPTAGSSSLGSCSPCATPRPSPRIYPRCAPPNGWSTPNRPSAVRNTSWNISADTQAYADGRLQFFGELQPLRDPAAFAAHLSPLRAAEWVVYAKPPFGGAQRG